MKTIFTIIFSLFFFLAYAQSEYNFIYLGATTNLSLSYAPTNLDGVKSLSYKVETHKNGKIKKYKSNFNDSGKLLQTGFYNKEGFQLSQKNEYNENDKLILQELYKRNGKLKSRITIKRNSKGEYLEYSYYNANGKLKNYNTWNYNENGLLSSSENFKRNGEQLKKKWVYEYYDDAQKKQTTLYNGKAKVKQIWTYACKEEGEQLEKKKDVTQLCKWEETDGKFLTKVTQSFDEKGKVIRQVHKYNIEDTSIVESKYYNRKNELWYSLTFDSSIKRPLTARYFKKGKEISKLIYSYEKERLVLQSFTNKSKTTKTSYEYIDEKLTAINNFNKKGDLEKTTTYEYN